MGLVGSRHQEGKCIGLVVKKIAINSEGRGRRPVGKEDAELRRLVEVTAEEIGMCHLMWRDPSGTDEIVVVNDSGAEGRCVESANRQVGRVRVGSGHRDMQQIPNTRGDSSVRTDCGW
jgi:hypothetical protein